jgi:transcription-repair coupling factor (superfamily II helicase)
VLFKAVDKQSRNPCATTILAYQHYRTFTERLKICRSIGYLNRFRTAKQKQRTLKDLAEGKLDIVIGTHQLVNKNVVFKDLGLLIVDEEQKFGVNVKDKLKLLLLMWIL